MNELPSQNFKFELHNWFTFWKQWQVFMNMSWHHDCYSSIKDLALYSHWQRGFFFSFCSSKCGKKKEGEARTKKSKKKRMKINRWLQWRLWQFEQQCLKYTAAATVCNPTRSRTASVTSLVELEKAECLYWRFVFVTHQFIF